MAVLTTFFIGNERHPKNSLRLKKRKKKIFIHLYLIPTKSAFGTREEVIISQMKPYITPLYLSYVMSSRKCASGQSIITRLRNMEICMRSLHSHSPTVNGHD